MHIAFVDFVSWDYTIDTVYRQPLGGSQSALCYLAEELARRGHQVQLINNAAVPGGSRGVIVLPLAKAHGDVWKNFDAVVLLNAVKPALALRPLLRADARLVAWIQHADDQPAVQPLARAEVRDQFAGFALLSDWQRDGFVARFGLDPARVRILRNAIGPAFCDRFRRGANLVAEKPWPPVLAYTSTPFRGLDLLVHLFPEVRANVKGATLRIFSSMQVYRTADETDAARYGSLYQLCRDTPGIDYIGSLPQPELAERMREVALLAYPNHFPETSCIAAIEAMASGCRIVTSQLGALPETTAGFARLIPTDDDWLSYVDRFTRATIETLEEFERNPDSVNELLSRQVEYVNAECTWASRAAAWESWLAQV